MACTLAESPSDPLHRKLRQLCCLRRRFDCYRMERPVPGRELHPLKSSAFSRRTITSNVRGCICRAMSIRLSQLPNLPSYLRIPSFWTSVLGFEPSNKFLMHDAEHIVGSFASLGVGAGWYQPQVRIHRYSRLKRVAFQCALDRRFAYRFTNITGTVCAARASITASRAKAGS